VSLTATAAWRFDAKSLRAVVVFVGSILACPLMPAEGPSYRDAKRPVEERIADLLGRMTLGEKIDQLHQGNIGDANPNNLSARAAEFRPTFGSYIIGGPSPLEVRNAVQQRAITESRLGIPALFGADVIHGWRLILPIPLAQACSWDPALIERGASLAAREAHAHGVDWTFAPMVDHCVDPRWGRIAETWGESPYASSIFAAACVRGYQGSRLGEGDSIAACLKHYVGYGASEGGRDYSPTEIPAQMLWEKHLPAFEAGVRAGARTVMSAFNDLNGIPTSANRRLLTEILREQWGFSGLVVSDWNAVLQLTHQGFAADEIEAAEKAINAGVDLDMADGLYSKHLADLVAKQRVSLTTLDEAVRRVLRVKFELGLFERPITAAPRRAEFPPERADVSLAEELAANSIVLLKNEGVLPLAAPRIALIGPIVEHRAAHLGSWAQQGRAEETPTLAEALRAGLPSEVTLCVERGCGIDDHELPLFNAACAAARDSDVVLLCLGEEPWMSGENASRSTLRPAGRQEALAQAIIATGKPVVLVLVCGRPLDLRAIEPHMRGVVAAWQGGTRAAEALADVLLGRRNPSGRLAVTWPRSEGQIPLSHDRRPRARLGDEGAYKDIPVTPLYEFGYGLSYTTFRYGELVLDREEVETTGRMTAEITVTNNGPRDGQETVLWFIRDPAASITRPLKELRFFEKAFIAAGNAHVFRFTIEASRDLSFPDSEGRRITEPGEIQLFAGPSSTRFHVVTPSRQNPTVKTDANVELRND
jgi:beta-glucosidase